MDKKLLDILVCPMCNSKLNYIKDKKVLLCQFDRVTYPIEDDIPVLLPERTTRLTAEQLETLNG
ncbi:Trm112 family protein [Aliikangiella coralliicola]|uniref:UPF0434 protein FLL46_18095 n=1 Tax=Aliikangiella coralliicola TaxID=2592383 RepID=A0A545U8Q0_9GAMM|nr:Trm112 family protein [Aliikangiella coralliicola]TQV85838.1 Trm112 family protein [Aliikangiella coralliicola]